LPLIVIPAYQAQRHVGDVVRNVLTESKAKDLRPQILVVDDGSTDQTAAMAAEAGAEVVRHAENRGKGAALVTGFRWAKRAGYAQVVTADADGQHPPSEILKLTQLDLAHEALVLGVRSLARDGAPAANQFSNALSNRFLSWFTGLSLRDTQCGLRRYPVDTTLRLACKDPGYAFEAEVLLRAARVGLPIEQLPILVYYPPKDERLSHFHVAKDPYRIVLRVVATIVEAS
jgi:glycosyltransferase involved in cell wall biosynthesis